MENIFLTLLNMSISAGWVAAAVLVLRLFMRRVPRWIHCLLWALVGIRLIWPFSIESVLSLLPSAQTVPTDILYMQSPSVETGIEVFNETVNPVIADSFAAQPSASVNPLQIWTYLAGWIWLIGLAAMVLYMVISTLRIRRKLDEAVETEPGIWLCDGLDTPFILGMIRPRIYLPSSMDPRDSEYVLAHERAHLKRRDHWWKPLGFALLSVYWFNPILWMAYWLLCKDIELACDEKVISELGSDSKKAYSTALINCSVPRRMLAACPLAFGEVGVKQRVKAVLHYKKPAFWVILAAVVVCVAAAVCFLTDPKGKAGTQQYAVGGIVLEVPEGMLAEHSSHVSQLSDRTIYHEGLHVRVSDDPYEPVHPGIVNIQYAELDVTPERYGLPEGTSMQEDFLQQEGVVERVAVSKLASEDKDSVTNIHGTTRYVGKGIEALEVTCDAVVNGINVNIRNLTFYEDGNEYSIEARWRADATKEQKEKIRQLIDSVKLIDQAVPDYRGLVAPMETSPKIMAIHCPTANEKGESSVQIGNANAEDLARWLNTTQWQACDAPLDSLPSPGSVEFVLDSEYYQQRITVYQKKEAAPFAYAEVSWRGITQYYSIGLNDYDSAKALLEAPDFPVATQWFDYTDGYWPQNMESLSYQMTKPVGFLSCTAEKLSLITEKKETKTLYEGMPIWNAYFIDLNDDGVQEICSTVSIGSGIIDNRIMVYDLAAGQDYELEDRGKYNYNLLLHNGQLLVTQSDARSGEALMTGQLALEDGHLQLANGSPEESSTAYMQTEPAVQETQAAGSVEKSQWFTIGVLGVNVPQGVIYDRLEGENSSRDVLTAWIDSEGEWPNMKVTIQQLDVGMTEEAYGEYLNLKESETVNDWYVAQPDSAEKLIKSWSYQRLENVQTISTTVTPLGSELKAVDVTFTGKAINGSDHPDLTMRVLQFYHDGHEYGVVAFWRNDAPDEAKKAAESILDSLHQVEDNGSLHRLGDLQVRVPEGMLADYSIINRENDLYQECLTLSVPMTGNELNKAYMDIRFFDNDSTEKRYAEYLEPGQTVNDWYIHQENAHRDLINQNVNRLASDWKKLDSGFFPLNDSVAAVDVTVHGNWLNDNRDAVTVRALKFYHGGREYVVTAYLRDDAAEEEKAVLKTAMDSLRLS